MKEIIKNIKRILGGEKKTPYKLKQKTSAQSMVEFAILLPLLILLLLIIVELGFALNTYLSLLDATRQTARVYSNVNPFILETDDSVDPPVITKVDNPDYYDDISDMLVETLNSNSYQIEFDQSAGSPDNILVSVIGVDVDTTTDPDTVTIIRHPADALFWTLVPANINPEHTSHYDNNDRIKELMTKNGSTPVNAGLLIIEIYYGYEGTLQIPSFFGVSFATDDNPFVLHASTIMPLGPAKPSANP